MTDENFRERFLKANATAEIITQEFSDVIRDLMRAASSEDPQHALAKATKKMNYVSELLRNSDENITWYQLFSGSIKSIQGNIPSRFENTDYIHAAMRGIKYFVEYSCSDSAAQGRTSQRLDEFMRSYKWAEEARAERAEKIRNRTR